MTDTISTLVELIGECDAQGIRLLPADGGSLTIDAAEGALTTDLVARLKARKFELLAMLRPAPEVAPALSVVTTDAPSKPAKPVCRCDSTTWRDVPIHGGQSVRRDCGRCGRFLDFPSWYGKVTGRKGQHPI